MNASRIIEKSLTLIRFEAHVQQMNTAIETQQKKEGNVRRCLKELAARAIAANQVTAYAAC